MPEKHEESKTGVLKGEVMGYVRVKSGVFKKGYEYTRGMHPANVFVKIVVPGKEKQKIYSPYQEKDMGRLKEEHPDIYEVLFKHEKVLQAHPTKEDGTFEITVPIGWWEYIACAYAEDVQGQHTDEMGNNGNGKNIPINPGDLLGSSHHTLEHIIVPVKDKWWVISEGVKKGDPKTDPKTVPEGVLKEEEAEKYLEKVKELDKQSKSG